MHSLISPSVFILFIFLLQLAGYHPAQAEDTAEKLAPFFYLDFDWGESLVNLTPHSPSSAPRVFILDDFKKGFQKISFRNLTSGLGAHLSFWNTEAARLPRELWRYVGLIPFVGRESRSVKFYPHLRAAQEGSPTLEVPSLARALDLWSPGDSLTYRSHGGLLFAAGLGMGAIGLGTTGLAQGTWEISIEKITDNKVYVKITREELKSLSFFTGIALAQVALSAFREADRGFSFLFDLRRESGRRAYEDMIRGNVIAADYSAGEENPAPFEQAGVVKIASFQSLSSGRLSSSQQGLPGLWLRRRSRGHISSFAVENFPLKKKNTRAYYGVFSQSQGLLFFNQHRKSEKMFYGAHLQIHHPQSSQQVQFGQFRFLHTDDTTTGHRLEKKLKELLRQTGIEELSPTAPAEKLHYVGIDFELTFHHHNTLRLMTMAQEQSQTYFIQLANKYFQSYRKRKDPYNYCRGPVLPGCLRRLSLESQTALVKMHQALRKMYQNQHQNPEVFAQAYAEFGEALCKNHISFRSGLELAGPGAEIHYLLEGTRLSLYFRSWRTTDIANHWDTLYPPKRPGEDSSLPFDPRLRHARWRGLIMKPGLGGVEIFKNHQGAAFSHLASDAL